MFGRLAAVRIKAAEDALERGRLDEAFEIASAEDLAGNRRITKLLSTLTEPLLQRGQDHLLSKRFAEALADFDRAARCGDQQERVGQWRQRAMEAMVDDRQAEQDRRVVLAAARERLAAGSLVGAAEALARAPSDDKERAAIDADISRQTRRAEEAIAEAKTALKEGHIAEAAKRLQTAKSLNATADGLTEMESKLVNLAVKHATEEFKGGRLGRVRQHLDALADLGRGHPEREEMEEALRLGREAAAALAEDRYAKAGVLLGRLTQVSPKAGWITDVRKHLKELESHRRALLEGPLGLISGHEVPSAIGIRPRGARAAPRVHNRPMNGDETLPAVPQAPARRAREAVRRHDSLLPTRLLLRIDGVGSFLLLRGDRISIGRSGPGATADLQLISDLADRQADIVRAGEDYFVVSQSGVELAGRCVDHALLQDGDRIRLGKRIRMKFGRPSLKSTTAVLDLGDGVRTTSDCRRVILWDGPLLIGGTRECHVGLSPGVDGSILMERGGQLLLKPMGPGGTAVPLVLGVQTEQGALRLSAQPWPNETSVGKVIG